MAGMTSNSRWDNQLAEIRSRANRRRFWQDVQATQVTPDGPGKNAELYPNPSSENSANLLPSNAVQTGGGRKAGSTQGSIEHKTLALNGLAAFRELANAAESEKACHGGKNRKKLVSARTFVRWSKFNFVGGIGIAVQFVALFLLKSVFHLNYLAATALAVEIAVLHNFVWHERFTWADRVPRDRARSWRSLARLVRFHLGNGAISILGNLALMKVLVGQGHMHYMVANAIAITLCSLANFLVSEAWVFGD